MKVLQLTCAGLFALAASACSLQPVYQRPAMPVASAYPTTPGEQQLPISGSASAAELGWRKVFTDERLQQLIALALSNNRDLRVAALNVERVRAQFRIQRSSIYPQVDLTAGSTQRGGPGSRQNSATGNNSAAGLTASWELDFFGRLQSLSDSAFERYISSQYGRQAAQILLITQVANQYLQGVAIDEALVITENALRVAQESNRIVQLQYDVGTASALDLQQSLTAMEEAKANRQAQLRLRSQSENALVLLVGRPLPPDLPPPTGLDAQQLASIPSGLPSDLLNRRPDIIQAEAILRGENADIGAARAAFFPRISLTGNLGLQSSALSGLFKGGAGAWSFAPSLVTSIFDAGANQANLDATLLQKDIGVAQYEKAVQTAFQEVADGLAARGTYGSQLHALENEVKAQQRRLELSSMLYSNGSTDYLQVLISQTALYNVQIARITTQLGRLTSEVNLYRALGGGWMEGTGDKSSVRDPEVGTTVH